jgi:hypothetical protein
MKTRSSLAIWGVGVAAASGPARLHATRYLETAPSPDRPTWPHLPASFPGPVLDVALGAGTTLWLLGGNGTAWCCADASDLAAATCGPSAFQLAEGATRVVAGGGSMVALASGASFALATQAASGCEVAEVNVVSNSPVGAVGDLAIDDATGSLWVGGATGSLWRLPSSPPGAAGVEEEASFGALDGTGITALAVGAGAGKGGAQVLLAVATELALYHSYPDPTAASGRGWRHDWLQVLLIASLSTWGSNTIPSHVITRNHQHKNWTLSHVFLLQNGHLGCALAASCTHGSNS